MLRDAHIKDVPAIHRLLNEFGQKGELLPRPLSALYENIRNFSVFEDSASDVLIGCCSLQICWEDLAEIRSLAVDPSHWGRGIGTDLVKAKLSEARRLEINRIFALTYRPSFFERFGFRVIDRSDLPLKIWSDCITCVKFPDCDETAMLKEDTPSPKSG